MQERCEKTELLKDQCAHCRGDKLGDESDYSQQDNFEFRGLNEETTRKIASDRPGNDKRLGLI